MVWSEIKMRVAQNCHEYKTKYSMGLINSISFGPASCDGCVNYVKGKCADGLFDEIREIISVN
ncbi:MAG TPA: hypothetical protein VIM70_00205 [Clostridium sp.]|uniref:hypothetical protein n=1 Tax=Clostridium sp. TaxID=1506 RepID=UPI002F94239B